MNSLSLSQFKKMKEDKKTVTMGHPSGHTITIYKSKLPLIQRKQLENLPIHAADGVNLGSNSNDDDSENAPVISNNTNALPIDPNQVSQAVPQGSGASGEWNENTVSSDDKSPPTNAPILADNTADAGIAQAASAQNESNTSQNPGDIDNNSSGKTIDINKAYEQGQRAITEQQAVAANIAKSQADAIQNDIDARQDFNDNLQTNLSAMQKHTDDFADYVKSNPINPKHYQENMSSGQKVSTAIGLLLGGFNVGFGHGSNPAMDFLNKQIDRDIAGQEQRMDQQKTILGANQQLYQDKTMAQNATRINMNDLYDHQIQLASAQNGGAAAAAAALAAHSQLAMQSAALLKQNAIYGTAMQALKNNGGAGLQPATLGTIGLMQPEDAQKEQQALTAYNAGSQRIMDLYNQADKEQTVGNLINPESYFNVAGINSRIVDAIMAMDVNHRYSEESAKALLKPNLINTGDDQAVRMNKVNNVLAQVRADALGNMSNLYRIAPNAIPNYTYQTKDQKIENWAANNPNDKRAFAVNQASASKSQKAR